jgi:hypothetical protein
MKTRCVEFLAPNWENMRELLSARQAGEGRRVGTPPFNTLPEKQCNPLPADDFTDFVDMRIWKEVDPVTQQAIARHQYTILTIPNYPR